MKRAGLAGLPACDSMRNSQVAASQVIARSIRPSQWHISNVNNKIIT